jgi:uncharacterized protein DUF5667
MSEREDRDLERFAARISSYERPRAANALRAQLRASLLAAPVTPVRRPSVWARASLLRPMLAAAVVLALLVGAGGSAAASSLPGDPAFGLRRAVEETQLAFTFDDAARLDALVALADQRLADLVAVTRTRPASTGVATDEYLAAVARVDAALTALRSQPRSAPRDAAIARALSDATDHIARLQTLATLLPQSAQPGIQRAIDAQQTLHGKTGDALPTTPVAPTAPVTPRSGDTGAPGRPSTIPGATLTPGRGGPPSSVPRP